MNKVFLMGRLTKDPEMRATNNNTQLANFSIAVNRRFVKPGEERQADFINIVAWSKLGEFCGRYFKKGMQVVVIGRIQNRSWETDGKKYYATDIIAEEAYFADSKRQDDGGGMGNFPSHGSDTRDSYPTQTEGFFPQSQDDDELPF